jgi:hypothetical protein
MKAKMFRQIAFDGLVEAVRGRGRAVIRLVFDIPEKLAITPDMDRLYAVTGFNTAGCDDLRIEVDVPDAVVQKALELCRVETEFQNMLPQLAACLPFAR